MRSRRRICVIAIFLAQVTTTCSASADTITEREPNDSPETATGTVGINQLTVQGQLNSIGDQDYFTFAVADLGTAVFPFPATVRIEFLTSPTPYVFELTSPSGEIIFDGQFFEPRIFDFNPSGIGGVGRYLVRISSGSPAAVGTYEFSIFGTSEGPGSVPPTVLGTANTPTPIPVGSPLGIVLLGIAITVTGLLARRRMVSLRAFS